MSNDICAKLGQRVRKMRLARKQGQVELAEMLGIDRSYLSEIETGKKNPSLTTIQILAKGLGTTVSRLLKGL